MEQVSATAPIALGHGSDNSGDGPVAAGLGITANGKTLIVANYMHDSISFVDLTTQQVKGDLDLRPGMNISKSPRPYIMLGNLTGSRAFFSHHSARALFVAKSARRVRYSAQLFLKLAN
jgi:DNA-binding beta-propeller fold protein YncE